MELVMDAQWTGDGFAIVEQTCADVSRARADEIAWPIGLTEKEIARILNLSERTLQRLRPDSRLDSNAPERLLLLESLGRIEHDIYG